MSKAKLVNEVKVKFYEEMEGPCKGSQYIEIAGTASVEDLEYIKYSISEIIRNIVESEGK